MSAAGSASVVKLRGERLHLQPEGALYWERRRTLAVADPHWGKDAAFRAWGVPVPGAAMPAGLHRLDEVIQRVRPGRVIFLGDLLHAREARSAATLDAALAWRQRHADVEMTLVRGNHDRSAGDPPGEMDVRCVDEPLLEPPFAFAHHPVPHPEGYVLAGHLHPAVRLHGAGRQRERLPCFWFGARVGVLPAFGEFTGSADVYPAPGDRVFVLAGGSVVEVVAPAGR